MTDLVDKILNDIIVEIAFFQDKEFTPTKVKYSKRFREVLEKHLNHTTPCEHKPTQKELDNRDNDLANIFNTSPKEEDKGDLYMRIIDYLVKKGFLQKGKDSDGLNFIKDLVGKRTERIIKEMNEPKVSEGIEKLRYNLPAGKVGILEDMNVFADKINELIERINNQ